MVCDFWGVRSGVAEDSVLLGHDVAQMGKRITAFRWHYFPTKGCDPIAHCYGVIFQRCMEFNLARKKNTAYTAPILTNLPSAQQHQNREVYVKTQIQIHLRPEGKFWLPLCQIWRNCLVIRNTKIVKSVSILRWQCGGKNLLSWIRKKELFSSAWQLMSMNYPYMHLRLVC
jgi:hypothetical protein